MPNNNMNHQNDENDIVEDLLIGGGADSGMENSLRNTFDGPAAGNSTALSTTVGDVGLDSFSNSLNFGDSFRDFIGGNVANVFGSGISHGGTGTGRTSAAGVNSLMGSFMSGQNGDFRVSDGFVGGTNHGANRNNAGDICGGMGGILNSFTGISNRNDGNRGVDTATNLTPINQVIAHQTSFNQEIADDRRLKQKSIFRRNFNIIPQQIRQMQQQSVKTNNTSSNRSQSNSGNSEDTINGEDAISDLSRRVHNMSVTERQKAQNDVYGFRLSHNNEDPVKLNIWMNQMDEYIREWISGNDRSYSALRLAMHTETNFEDGTVGRASGAEYVKSQKLKFLRAADWKADDAVRRLSKFLELKLEHFGSELLTRDLTLRDLPKQDLDLWRQYGFVQLSEERDAYGRPVLVFIGKQQYPLPVDTVIRILLYLSLVLTKDESIQKTGCIQIFWGHGQMGFVDGRATKVVDTFRGIPLRGVGKHLCYDDSNMQRLFSIIARVAMTWGAVRTRAHQGTMMECTYNLMTYGIPRKAIPLNDDEQVELEFLHCFLDAIERRENEERERKIIHGFQEPNQKNFLHASRATANEDGQQGQGRSSLFSSSWNNMSGDQVDPLNLSFGNLDELPPDFINRLENLQSSTNSAAGAPMNATTPNVASSSLDFSPAIDALNPTPLQESSFPNDSRFGNSTAPNTANISGLKADGMDEKRQEMKPQAGVNRNDGCIFVPGPLDVIMGRGRHNKKKPGNRKLNLLLESFAAEYEASDKFQKTVMSEIVVSKMHAEGSRFLVREGDKKHGIWVEVSVEKARDKVAHDFRNLRRNAKLAKEKAAAEAAAQTISQNSTSSSGITLDASNNSSKRRRSAGTTASHDEAHESKRTHGILEEFTMSK